MTPEEYDNLEFFDRETIWKFCTSYYDPKSGKIWLRFEDSDQPDGFTRIELNLTQFTPDQVKFLQALPKVPAGFVSEYDSCFEEK